MRRSKKNSAPLRVAIVGAGRVGSVLGRILTEEGGRVTAVVSRTRASARRGARFVKCPTYSTALTAIPLETDVVFITTPHDAVGDVARTLARLEGLDFGRMAVCHASGMLTASILEPLAMRGAAVFSFHPLQTFPRDFAPRKIVPTARGIFYGVDGPPRGVRVARRMARVLCGHVILIPADLREFYHAACVVASNHLTTLLWTLQLMHRLIRPGDRAFFPVYRPIIEATLVNIAASSPAAALSGPIARGGVETVARHLEALRLHAPELLPLFTRLSLETARLATEKGSLPMARREALDELIRSYSDEQPPIRKPM